ncbi:MAG: FAD-dependent monooxygenase [Isosphaeraceae bacterium]|nr:FAD-dependent monooxygenase [Isosphaeraceae bacterium]
MPPCPPPPDPSRPFEVAIAGAGPAGASLALKLARRGVRIALLDAAVFPRDKLCGEFLSPEAWSVLDRLGLANEVAQSGYHAIRRVRLSTPRGRILDAEILRPDGRPGLGLSRSILDNLLVQQARKAGATVFEGCRVGGPIIRDGRVVGLRGRHAVLGAIEVEATVVIAADGRRSVLVQQTGMIRGGSRFRPRYFGLKRHLTIAEPIAAGPDGTVSLHLLPGGYGGICRIEGSLTNLCALLPESALHRHRGRLDDLATDWFGRNPILARCWRSAVPASGWKTVSGIRVEVATPRLPGILYAGDCQGTVDPLGGQGMTMALLGAELLTPFVAQALASGGADPCLQRAYVTAWHRRFDRRVRLCRLFHHILVNPALIDLASAWRPLATWLLAAGYRRTRDPETMITTA